MTTSRTAIFRMYTIDQLIRERRYPNTQSLAERLEVDRRTIQRDIAYMRDMMGAPVAYSNEHSGFHYTTPAFMMPAMTMTGGEILAMFLAEKVVRQYHDTPYAELIADAFEKLARYLPEGVSINMRELEPLEAFHARAVTVQQLETFNTVAQATIARERLSLSYFAHHRDLVTEVALDPYHLGNVNGDWYLFGHCHEVRHIRVLLCSRIRRAGNLGVPFAKPEFGIKEYLRDCVSVLRLPPAAGSIEVALRFDPTAARVVRDCVWHPSQRFKLQPDGTLELFLRVRDIDEIGRWVLSWGTAVTVQKPQALRKWVADQARAILDGA